MADIVIRCMEMPENCGECKAFVCYRQWAGDGGDCFCGITKVDAKADARNADCPLAPLPEGHGRLIDADALLAVDRQIYAGNIAIGRRYYISPDEVCDAPTILEAEGDDKE